MSQQISYRNVTALVLCSLVLLAIMGGVSPSLPTLAAHAASDPPTPPPLTRPTRTPMPSGNGTGLSGAYYGDTIFGALKLTRTDATINFAWGNGAPAPSLPADNFSVRWSGRIVARYSERYTFRVTADDGVRLWVGGQLIADAWNGAYGGVDSAPVALSASQSSDIRIDYREIGGSARVMLEWSSASQRQQIVPQSQLIPFSATPAPRASVPWVSFGG
jgi:PA14 domain-containing protein